MRKKNSAYSGFIKLTFAIRINKSAQSSYEHFYIKRAFMFMFAAYHQAQTDRSTGNRAAYFTHEEQTTNQKN